MDELCNYPAQDDTQQTKFNRPEGEYCIYVRKYKIIKRVGGNGNKLKKRGLPDHADLFVDVV
jgi:hypothetical protein